MAESDFSGGGFGGFGRPVPTVSPQTAAMAAGAAAERARKKKEAEAKKKAVAAKKKAKELRAKAKRLRADAKKAPTTTAGRNMAARADAAEREAASLERSGGISPTAKAAVTGVRSTPPAPAPAPAPRSATATSAVKGVRSDTAAIQSAIAGTTPAAPAAAPAPAVVPAGGGAPVAGAGAAVAGAPPVGAAEAPAAGSSAALAKDLYAHMAWALNEPELGPILNKAAEEGWDENRLRGAIFATNWFRTHGTAKVAAQLKEEADAYLVPMDDATRRNWAMKVITGEVQEAEFANYVKEQAKSMFPTLAAAIDRGISVADYAAPYRALAAQTLEIAPESINLADAQWRRALDGSRDDKGQPAVMSLSDWERTLKQDTQYGWDRTKQARQQAAAFATQLQEKFGAVA